MNDVMFSARVSVRLVLTRNSGTAHAYERVRTMLTWGMKFDIRTGLLGGDVSSRFRV